LSCGSVFLDGRISGLQASERPKGRGETIEVVKKDRTQRDDKP
jgi:hypothetical protein